jgi:hypothetical protein
MTGKRDRIALVGIIGLLFLASCLLDADPAWPGWVTGAMALLLTGTFVWVQWNLSGEPGKRTLDAVLSAGLLAIAATTVLVLLIACP